MDFHYSTSPRDPLSQNYKRNGFLSTLSCLTLDLGVDLTKSQVMW